MVYKLLFDLLLIGLLTIRAFRFQIPHNLFLPCWSEAKSKEIWGLSFQFYFKCKLQCSFYQETWMLIGLVWSSGRSWSQRLYFLPEKGGHKHCGGARGREVKEGWVINDHSPTSKEGIFAGDVNYIPIFSEASALTHVTMSARSWACCSGNTVEGCDGQTMCGF